MPFQLQCLNVVIFVFILFGTVCISSIWIFLSFPMLGKFSAIMSSNMVSNPFLLSSPSGTPILWLSVSLILSQSSLKLSSLKTFFLSHSLSLFFFCSGWVISAALSSILLIHSTVSSNILLIPFSVFYWEGNGIPLQYSCLENPMDRGAWWAAVHGIAKSRTWLSDFTFTFHFYALGKKMATHSSVLAWRLPGTGEPGGLPSMGSHRVGHDWSNLAAAAAAAAICKVVLPK